MDSNGTYAVVHDESVEFRTLFARITDMFSVAEGDEVDLTLEDGTRHRAALRNFAVFSMKDSKAEPLLQVADLVASSTARAARIASFGTNANKEARDLTRFALGPLRHHDAQENQLFAGIFASPDARRALKAAIGM
jgi:hypothetical protein